MTIRRLSLAILFVLAAASRAGAQAPVIVEYYHTDPLGSVRAVTDHTGTVVVRRHDFFPFGVEHNAPSAEVKRWYTGKERDPETGLDYFYARYLSSSAGRFTTVDPGQVGASALDPQSWNAYAYARNNPLRYVDPSGTAYHINVYGSGSFWIDDDSDLSRYEQGGFTFRSGVIFNAAGQSVGSYQHYSSFDRVFLDAGNRAAPGVNSAAGALSVFATVVAPVPMAIAGCVASWAECRSSRVSLAMALSPKAAKILGNLGGQAAKTIAQLIRLRGGGGSQINAVATYLRNLSLGEVAERAAGGDEAAKTAIKIVKDAKRLGEKY
jgi:RHS repeat-associated protein